MTTPIKNSLDYKFYGPEPKEYSRHAINWYTHFCDKKDYISFLKIYIKKNKLSVELPVHIGSSIGIIAHFINTNRKVPEESINKFNEFISKLPKGKKEEITENVPKKSVRDYVEAQCINFCGILDNEIDVLLNNFKHKFDIKKFSSRIKKPHAKIIKEFYERQYNDTLIKDEFTKEGYSYMSKKEFKIYQDFLKSIIDEMDKIFNQVRRVSVRRKKETPAYKKVQKLKYLPSSNTYNIQSTEPEKIIKSEFVLTFDVKTGILSVLIADRGGFDVSGTTLKNLSDKSFKKKLRKPQEFLKNINKTKLQLLNLIEKEKTKATKVTGRFNDKTLILKVL